MLGRSFLPILFNKLKDNMQSVYKTEEHMARVKQSKELGIELNEITIAGLSEEEYSKVVNLAKESSRGSPSFKFSVTS
jgi:hypothetical protein